jgi:phosphate acyltransferase
LLTPIHLAVDGMGGDNGPRLAFEACHLFLQHRSDVTIHFFAQDDVINQPQTHERFHWVSCDEAVGMADEPANALRHKQRSSMAMALQALRSGTCQVCVSAGNTGALVAFSRHILAMQPGIDRPALCRPIPTEQGACWMLDLGANLEASASMLVQFAHLARPLAARLCGREPRVALLNLGTEAAKGLLPIREAAQGLQSDPALDYVGYLEPSDLFSGRADVVVCSGFAGNMALKASEGAATFLFAQLRKALAARFGSRVLGFLLKPLLKKLHRQFHPAALNGAFLLGVNGVVVKSHGAADLEGFLAALRVAADAVLAQGHKENRD